MSDRAVAIAKADSIERCLNRVRELYADDPQTRQDALVLNLLRACETVIDLGMHEVSKRRLGTPTTSRDAFALLVDDGLLPPELGRTMSRMVGFRNLAVHQYLKLDLGILVNVVEKNLPDFYRFLQALGLRK